jgi:hypothetical protein
MDFPLVIIKEDLRYMVHCQAELDYHLGQGWKVQTVEDYTGMPAARVEAWAHMIDGKLLDYDAQIARILARLEHLEYNPEVPSNAGN